MSPSHPTAVDCNAVWDSVSTQTHVAYAKCNTGADHDATVVASNGTCQVLVYPAPEAPCSTDGSPGLAIPVSWVNEAVEQIINVTAVAQGGVIYVGGSQQCTSLGGVVVDVNLVSGEISALACFCYLKVSPSLSGAICLLIHGYTALCSFLNTPRPCISSEVCQACSACWNGKCNASATLVLDATHAARRSTCPCPTGLQIFVLCMTYLCLMSCALLQAPHLLHLVMVPNASQTQIAA